MNKQEYELQKELIIKQYGVPEYDMREPVNESAKKLVELRQCYSKAKSEAFKTKKLADAVKEIAPEVTKRHLAVPDEVIRSEWLVSFSEPQKAIVKQWMKNVKASPEAIAKAINSTPQAVRACMSLEAFGLLRRHLTLGIKDLLPLESVLALREVIADPNVGQKLKAALTVLMDAGHIKGSQMSPDEPNAEVTLDKDQLEKLRKLGDQII